MLQNWRNFLFASFDPAGYITVDKPPAAFWVQAAFAYVFGVHGWSVILPQALAGVGSVLLVYVLVKPAFGKTAARLASLVMASTPIAVAVSRTNNIDSLLVFTLLIATWMLFRAVRSQKFLWLLGAFAMIGAGFNMKMFQAYMVVPAFCLLYLIAYEGGWKKKLAVLAAATAVMVVVSGAWATVVEVIPPENRPYIGGSRTNSVLELAVGYNGIMRLTGMHGWGAGPGSAQDRRQMPAQDEGARPDPRQMPQGGENVPDRLQGQQEGSNAPAPAQMPPDKSGLPGAVQGSRTGQGSAPGFGGGRPQGRGGGAFGTGQPGPLRLFQSELSGQTSWLLPFVGFACTGLLAGVSRKRPLTAKQKETLFWLAWLVPAMAFFSVAGFFHHYYLIMLAPPVAALAGAGWVELWSQYRDRDGWKMLLLPAGLLATTAFELYVLQPYQRQIGISWSICIGAAGAGLALVLFIAATIKQKPAFVLALAAMLVLLAAPLYWACTPLLYGVNYTMPQAGPVQQGFGQRPGIGRGPGSGVNEKLLEYLEKNNTGEKYLFATTDANTAAPYIIETGKAVMAMGGFSGSDPVLTVEKLKQMVANKEVKYFLIPSVSGFVGREGGAAGEVLEWIRANSTEVPREEWQPNVIQSVPGGMRDGRTLYKIKG
ncbi:MAG: phospholipid carrier-dependent glycosyltransferase [Pelotomaculum sp.]|nr:phospholipid carrier-dependent glycosyltransferase [Pelotomaculum sp.]